MAICCLRKFSLALVRPSCNLYKTAAALKPHYGTAESIDFGSRIGLPFVEVLQFH